MDDFEEDVFSDNTDEISQIQDDINRLLSIDNNEVETEILSELPEQGTPDCSNEFPENTTLNTEPKENSTCFYNETIKSKQNTKFVSRNIKIASIAFVLLLFALCFLIYSNIKNKSLEINEEVNTNPSENDYSNKQYSLPYNNEASSNLALSELSDKFVALVTKVRPSVACISILNKGSDFSNGLTNVSSASGVIFEKDAEKVYIVTNSHVLQNADEVLVSIEGSDSVTAKLVGSDTDMDLAVVSVLFKDLVDIGIKDVTVARFGNSDNIRVGELVLAIGNAQDEGTTTLGLVSAEEKLIIAENKPHAFLQTTAIINPGNSGGPLINMNAEVIAINTAKISNLYNAEGMGYSITSNKAKPIIEGFMNLRNQVFLGISGYDVTNEISQLYKLPQMGIYVVSVIEGSSAQKAGILTEDIIVSFNGDPTYSMDKLSEKVDASKVGDKIQIDIIRNGKESVQIEVILERYNDKSF